MAFPRTHNIHVPIRSISLPSRIHPPSAKLQVALYQLQLFQNSPSSDSQTLQITLLNLAQLYHSLHELNPSLPATRCLLRLAKDGLDVSAKLLDSCDASRNLLLSFREHLLNLQSALRRKERSDCSMEVQISEYFTFRGKAKKEMNKLLRGLKKLEGSVSVMPDHLNLTISVFRSLFLFLSTPTTKTKTCRLRFVSKLMGGGPGTGTGSGRWSSMMSEVQNVDVVLRSDGESEKMKKTLEVLEERIEGLEVALHSLFNSLVQNRVSLLNLLTTNS